MQHTCSNIVLILRLLFAYTHKTDSDDRKEKHIVVTLSFVYHVCTTLRQVCILQVYKFHGPQAEQAGSLIGVAVTIPESFGRPWDVHCAGDLLYITTHDGGEDSRLSIWTCGGNLPKVINCPSLPHLNMMAFE